MFTSIREMTELADEKWTSNDISARITQDMVDRACRAAGFRPRFTVEAQDHYTATAFVAAGVGITVLPVLASRSLPRTVRPLRLTKPNAVRDIVVSPHPSRGRTRRPASRSTCSSRSPPPPPGGDDPLVHNPWRRGRPSTARAAGVGALPPD